MTVRAPPHHHAKEPLKVRGVHNDHNLIGCEFLLLDDDILQLSLHPLRTASVLLGNLCVGLFAMGELFPNLLRWTVLFLTALFPALLAPPQLPTLVRAILLKSA